MSWTCIGDGVKAFNVHINDTDFIFIIDKSNSYKVLILNNGAIATIRVNEEKTFNKAKKKAEEEIEMLLNYKKNHGGKANGGR